MTFSKEIIVSMRKETFSIYDVKHSIDKIVTGEFVISFISLVSITYSISPYFFFFLYIQ